MWLSNGVILTVDCHTSLEWRNTPFTAVTPPRLLMKSDLSGEKARAWPGPGTGDGCCFLFSTFLIFLSSSSDLVSLWSEHFTDIYFFKDLHNRGLGLRTFGLLKELYFKVLTYFILFYFPVISSKHFDRSCTFAISKPRFSSFSLAQAVWSYSTT